MGSDHSTHLVFAGSEPGIRRAEIAALLEREMAGKGLAPAEPVDAARSFVVGPPERWIFVADSACGERWDIEAFREASAWLSRAGPTVDVHMSDSACLNLMLYRNGRLRDRVGNCSLDFMRPWSRLQRFAFRGRPRRWVDLVAPWDEVATHFGIRPSPAAEAALRAGRRSLALRLAWREGRRSAGGMLHATQGLLGWSMLAWEAYTEGDEGAIDTEIDWAAMSTPEHPFTVLHFA